MSNPSRRIRASILGGLAAAVLLAPACETMRLVNALDAESRDFYSKVRYIITKEESEAFLRLPAGERDAFIRDFWQRRDPDPETERNEFREEYMSRVETANKLFRSGGKEGFIQDRGRILILLGPPDEILSEPVGRYADARSYEAWNYLTRHQIQLVFVDANGDGEYTLVRPDTRALQIINRAQQRLRNPAPGEDSLDREIESTVGRNP